MFNINVKLKFIELKASGMPAYKIANELGVHRATLMRWNKELAPYVMIARQDVIDEMLFENGCMKLDRVEKISKYLTLFYGMLDIGTEDTDKEPKMDFDKILTAITKLTRLLMIESGSKSPETYLSNDKDYLTELPSDEGSFDTTVWVTDKEKFVNYEPDEEILNRTEEEIISFEDNLIKKKEENGGFVNSNPASIQDISDKSPELQEIFNKSMKRKYIPEDELKIEKCNNNVTMKAKDRKVRKNKKMRMQSP